MTDGTSESAARFLVDLAARLRGARVRWFLAALVRGAATSIGAGAVAGLAVGTWRLFAPSAPAPWPAFVAVLAAGLVLSVLAAARSTPTEEEAARRADAAFDLEQVVSTAREYAMRPPRSPSEAVLVGALLEDARSAVGRIDPRRLAPLRFHRWFLLPLALLGVLAVAERYEPVARVTVDPPASGAEVPAPVFEADERDAVGDEIDRLADAVEAEAERLRDPYLSVLADAMQDVASHVRSGDLSLEAASSELDTLLQHLESALDATVADRLAEVREARPGAPVPTMPLAAPDAPGSPSRTGGDELASRLREFTAAFDEAAAFRADTAFYFDAQAAEPAAREQRAAGVVHGEAAGDPAGAARRSTDAAGDAAGAGSTDLEGADPGGPAEFQSRDEVALPEAGGADGARVGASGEADDGAEGGIVARGGMSAEAGEGGGRIVQGAALPGGVRDEAGGWRRAALAPDALALASRLFAPDPAENP